MNTKLAWILAGSAALAVNAMVMGACSSDDNGVNDSGTKDSTAQDTGKADTGSDTGSSDAGTDTAPQDAGGDCETAKGPFTTDSGPYCPYTQAADGGEAFIDCNNGQHCCVYPTNANLPSTCNNSGVACTATDAGTTADFGCNETNDCATGICCLSGSGNVKQETGCTYHYGSTISGSACATSCSTAGQQLCGSQADCTGGTTCTPFTTKGIWLGVCL